MSTDYKPQSTGFTRAYLDKKRAEADAQKEAGDAIKFAEDPQGFLNHWVKTEIKIVKLPTNSADRLRAFQMQMNMADGTIKSSTMSRVGNTYTVKFHRDDNGVETYKVDTKNDKITNIKRNESEN